MTLPIFQAVSTIMALLQKIKTWLLHRYYGEWFSMAHPNNRYCQSILGLAPEVTVSLLLQLHLISFQLWLAWFNQISINLTPKKLSKLSVTLKKTEFTYLFTYLHCTVPFKKNLLICSSRSWIYFLQVQSPCDLVMSLWMLLEVSLPACMQGCLAAVIAKDF